MLKLMNALALLCFMQQVVVSNHSDLYAVVKINVVNIKAYMTKPKGSMGTTKYNDMTNRFRMWKRGTVVK